MKIFHPLLVVILLLVNFSPSALATVQETRSPSAHLVVNSTWIATHYGYYPFRINFTNYKKNSQTFTIRVHNRSRPIEIIGRRKFRVQGGKKISFTINLPQPESGNYFSIKVYDQKGNHLEDLDQFHSTSVKMGWRQKNSLLVISRLQPDLRWWEAGGKKVGKGTPSGKKKRKRRHFHRSRRNKIATLWIRPEEMPLTWISYSGISSIYMTLGDFKELTEERQKALRHWTYLGGQLLLAGSREASLLVREMNKIFPQIGESYRHKYGNLSSRQVQKVRARSWGMGQVVFLHSPRTFKETEDMDILQRIIKSAKDAILLRKRRSWRQASLPPAGVCLLILAGFSFFLIPFCYYVLRSQSRLILLYFLVPIFSFVITLLIFFASFTSEGTTPRVQAYSVSHLDQKSRLIRLRSQFQIYSSFSISGGLKFSPQTALFLTRFVRVPSFYSHHGSSYSRYSRHRETLYVKWSEGQNLSRGWVLPREMATFYGAQVGSTRRRLTFKEDGENITVTNNLGVSVKKIGYLWRDNFYLLGEKLEPGQTGSFKKVSKAIFLSRFVLKDFGLTRGKLPGQGSYFALLYQWPEVEVGLEDYKVLGGKHYLLGLRALPQK